MSRPSDGFTFDELREEFDWICEFQSRMAERISGNPDVHNHVDYVNGLEAENAKLRELVRDMWSYVVNREMELCNACSWADGDFADCSACDVYDGACGIAKKRFEELYTDHIRELGIEVDA